MALPMLVGGAECGPSNPLQGLSKRFDQDRGIQQDQFGIGRPGPSTDTFRTRQNTKVDADMARFFSPADSATPEGLREMAYDVTTLRAALPSQISSAIQPQQLQPPGLSAAWASDFAQQQPLHTLNPHNSSTLLRDVSSPGGQLQQYGMSDVHHDARAQWNPTFSVQPMNRISSFAPPITMHVQGSQIASAPTQLSWDKEFNIQELNLTAASGVPLQTIPQNQQSSRQTPKEADELARTAGLLLENMKDEQNPKFQKSEFMGLMKQLRDGNVVVEGNQMVENTDPERLSSASYVDKGKGRAIELPLTSNFIDRGPVPNLESESKFATAASEALANIKDESQTFMDANDAYFRQDNIDYIRYWNDADIGRTSQSTALNPEVLSWDQLQDDWERFEATTTGINPVTSYQFQKDNPYLIGDSTRTHHHSIHSNIQQPIFESVLNLEAVVQRDMNNASAWFELGVKQQENERESKAIRALQRAVELDSSHLPTWLALAISYTNESNRTGAYNAIHEWVSRNEKYKSSVTQFRLLNPSDPNALLSERYNHLIQCLIEMARSDTSGEIDADIQIALAVLLNANDDYQKAQDCFRTALAVRPEDWLLYNRVGATMANSGNAGEAIQYYYRALELNPGYIRARFNLGISCINLRRYEEAAQHILDALVLQDNDGGQDSDGMKEKRGVTSASLWESLKTTCLHMQRVDLATVCDKRDLEAFRNKFHG